MKVLKHFLLAALLAAAALSVNSCNKGGKLSSIVMTPSNNTSMANGTRQLFTATATFTDGSVFAWSSVMEWSSTVVSVATVTNDIASSKGLVDAISYGTTTITATDTVNNITVSTALTVIDPQSITVTPNNPYMAVNTIHQFNATASFPSGATQDITSFATWTIVSSGTPTIATINNTPGVFGNGIVNAQAIGTANVIADFFSVISGTISSQPIISQPTNTLTVTDVQVSTITLSAPSLNIPPGATMSVTATGNYSTSPTTRDFTSSVIWSSSNTAAAAINNLGIVTAGTTTGTTTNITAIDPITNLPGSPVLTLTVQ